MSESIKNPNWLSRSLAWVDARIPWTNTLEKHATKYYAPKNFNVWYVFGVLASFILGLQLLTGLWLTMSYEPTSEGAFRSVEYIMREVDFGWLVRYLHSTGASAFFLVIYLHMFRGFAYGSYRKPRELIWLIGIAIYLVLMAEGFFGYLLPWGNMSFWGAQVIVSLVGAVPIFGPDLMEWVRGDFVMSGITLNRFFALHVFALPAALVGLVFVHIVALHHVGSNNPDGIEIKENKNEKGVPVDGIPFHPYYTVHDFVAVILFLIAFCAVVFYAPEMFGYFIEKPNFEIANSLKTPEHIAPVWYYTPFYAMLRAATFPLFGLDAKFWGLVVMAGAILIPAALPWLDRSPVKSIRYKGRISKFMLGLLVVSFIVLGYLGTIPPSPLATAIAQIGTMLYFSYFLLMPWYTRREKTKPVPERVTGGH
ncbi:MAG: cytochrome bc complex cytochrome b subunit [Gammaproteobacteria bacterium]|nr:cytochrome bc complex cytochrome b subunit [Gammaproteobacteria bacterium]MDE0093857.1 cytochrome bc complex cytochrome b subunit [Gammaproteobacteria bacterium]MDE0252353.1 cytochrome bc complex cytochrome b subunit [Gammaproteobacteria bacterium]MDE0402538.1 cytochrome bc complex cytochrome b subunit [Gammaproteobacteria bacterium]MDE0645828.1 cytochrome bc complex cytochrome b subunit [Gammaproteobacteria bacterium]